jgi:hypothetical protein
VKAISIRQPWAWAILHAGKRVENRSWAAAPVYRGPLLIHASKSIGTAVEREEAARTLLRAGPGDLPIPLFREMERGGFVGRANLVDVVRTTEGGHRSKRGRIECALCGEAIRDDGSGVCSRPDPWAVPGALGLILADVEPLVLVPWRGELGLFEADVPVHRLEVAVGDTRDDLCPVARGAS